MIFLALETATSHSDMAIFHDEELLGYAECDSTQSLTTQIIPTFHQLLQRVSLTVTDLEGLAVSIGPGRFTGLRVGLATMTALRFALKIPLVGVSTLEGLAWNLPHSPLPIVSTVSIRAGMMYWGLFDWEHGQLVGRKTDQIGTAAEVCTNLSGPTIILGDGWMRNQDTQELDCAFVVEGPADAMWPSAKGIGCAGRVLLKEGQTLPEGCSPRYIQPSYAEMSHQGSIASHTQASKTD